MGNFSAAGFVAGKEGGGTARRTGVHGGRTRANGGGE